MWKGLFLKTAFHKNRLCEPRPASGRGEAIHIHLRGRFGREAFNHNKIQWLGPPKRVFNNDKTIIF
jgi:hypothetical protein